MVPPARIELAAHGLEIGKPVFDNGCKDGARKKDGPEAREKNFGDAARIHNDLPGVDRVVSGIKNGQET
jgi:hypothetical protein